MEIPFHPPQDLIYYQVHLFPSELAKRQRWDSNPGVADSRLPCCLCSIPRAFLCSIVLHSWADQNVLREEIKIVVVLRHEGQGCSKPAEFPCPLSCCAWFCTKFPGLQVKKWVLWLFNICVIRSSILAFVQEFVPQPNPSLWPERNSEEANPETLLLHNNLAECKSRKY